MQRRSPPTGRGRSSSWSVTVHGERGALRHGYQRAASLAGWTLERSPGFYQVTATVLDRHPLWSRQRSLDLVLEAGGRVYRWTGAHPPTADGVTVWLFRSPPLNE